MRTQRTIGLIIAGVLLAVVTLVALLVAVLGVARGLALALLGAVAVVIAYRVLIGPRLARWGATDAEVARTLPGDDRIPEARGSTRAIAIAAPPEAVWPWLVQLGWGRGGWYSYDWIDNDGRPSATRIVPELQDLAVGDRILMTPMMGPTVCEIVPGHHLVAADPAMGTWCLALTPTPEGCRLLSRWRVAPPASGPVAWLWSAISGPGSWLMERRMLRTIKQRAESGHLTPVG